MSAAIARDLATFVAAFVGSAALTPVARRVAIRTGIVDHPAPHKFHRRATPYLGGLAITAPVLLLLALQLFAPGSVHDETIAIGLGGLAVGAVGLIDDWRVLGAMPRLLVQGLAATGLWAAGIRLSPTGVEPIDFIVTVFVVLAVTNAFNLIDNMDGIADGTAAIAGIFFFVAAASEGQYLVGAMALAVAGGCLGFLPYNFPPAKIFLGDCGTLFLGFVLSVLFIKVRLNGYPLITRATVPVLIVAVPLFDMTLVVWSRWRAGRPIFRGGTDHSSHRIGAVVGSPTRVALITYAASVLTGTTASLLLLTRTAWPAWIAVGVALSIAATAIAALERLFEGGAEAPVAVRWPLRRRPVPAGV
jgi:UDP-GlcNAc:undecaprenyl-phosphate/decaprenyl-phosphate GlcNAc-1-phosphate transferase